MGEIYVAYEYWFAVFQLVFAMLGMGATLRVADFKKVLFEPKAVASGTTIQLVLVPVIAFVFISLTNISPAVAIGIALIAAIPGGTTSNIFTYFAKGNIPLSISITAITTLACLITTPLVLGQLITQHLPADFTMPTLQIVKEIAFTLLLPLAIGMAVLHYLPKIAPPVSVYSIRLSLIGIIAIVVGSSAAGRLDLEAFGTNNVWLVICFLLVISLIGGIIGKLISLSKQDQTAIQMEVIVRNVNLALLIKASMFPAAASNADSTGDLILFTILLYGALQMLLAGILIFYKRHFT